MTRSRTRFAIMAIAALATTIALSSSRAQNAKRALETYDEGPVWQILTYHVPLGRVELQLQNIATVWEHQLKLAVENGLLVDYKVLTKWAADPDDWNVMVIEMYPNWSSFDSFWTDWGVVDAQTTEQPEYIERLAKMREQPVGTKFLGATFAREIYLKPR